MTKRRWLNAAIERSARLQAPLPITRAARLARRGARSAD